MQKESNNSALTGSGAKSKKKRSSLTSTSSKTKAAAVQSTILGSVQVRGTPKRRGMGLAVTGGGSGVSDLKKKRSIATTTAMQTAATEEKSVMPASIVMDDMELDSAVTTAELAAKNVNEFYEWLALLPILVKTDSSDDCILKTYTTDVINTGDTIISCDRGKLHPKLLAFDDDCSRSSSRGDSAVSDVVSEWLTYETESSVIVSEKRGVISLIEVLTDSRIIQEWLINNNNSGGSNVAVAVRSLLMQVVNAFMFTNSNTRISVIKGNNTIVLVYMHILSKYLFNSSERMIDETSSEYFDVFNRLLTAKIASNNKREKLNSLCEYSMAIGLFERIIAVLLRQCQLVYKRDRIVQQSITQSGSSSGGATTIANNSYNVITGLCQLLETCMKQTQYKYFQQLNTTTNNSLEQILEALMRLKCLVLLRNKSVDDNISRLTSIIKIIH